MQALIIVDVQHDFLPGGSLPVPDGDQVIAVINELQSHFDLVVATQDWHPPDHMSFASNHEGRKPFEQIRLDGLDQVLWPDHCVQGSKGAEFPAGIELKRVEAIIRKGTDRHIDTYSGFYDNAHRKATGLAGYLRERGIRQVFVCGLAADICVYFTARDALAESFETFLIEDASRALDHADFAKAKADIEARGGRIIQSADVPVPV